LEDRRVASEREGEMGGASARMLFFVMQSINHAAFDSRFSFAPRHSKKT